MMTDKTVGVPWRELKRQVQHRTSAPTTASLRAAIAEITIVRGSAPSADAVILAALRLAAGPIALAAEIERIEGERFFPEGAK